MKEPLGNLIFEDIVKTGANHTYIIADDTGETFATWLHKWANKLEEKKIRMTLSFF